MTITLEIPEALARQLGADSPRELSRQALEALVLEAYRTDRMGGPQAAEVLGFSRMRWDQFLEEHHVLENAYTVEDLERDVATLRRLRAEGALPPAA
jgi:predicted HTH domain antitoxin